MLVARIMRARALDPTDVASSTSSLIVALERWRSVPRARRETATIRFDAFRAWRELANESARERRALVETVLALRVEVLRYVFDAWWARVGQKRRERALMVRRARAALRLWRSNARTEARRRAAEAARAEAKATLETKLELFRAKAERDAALERAKSAERMISALQFRSSRDARAAAMERNARAVAKTSPTNGALVEGRNRQVLVRALRELRAHYVAQLDALDRY